MASGLFDVKAKHVYTLKLPWPPSINDYYGTTPAGGKYIKAKGRKFREIVIECLREYMAKREPLTTKLQVWIEAHVPDKRRRDLDNIKKALLDALTHAGVYQDDCLIDDLRVVRAGVAKGGFVRVFVGEIQDES
jgi:crossover junction endodeoxyribonuclease RusA